MSPNATKPSSSVSLKLLLSDWSWFEYSFSQCRSALAWKSGRQAKNWSIRRLQDNGRLSKRASNDAELRCPAVYIHISTAAAVLQMWEYAPTHTPCDVRLFITNLIMIGKYTGRSSLTSSGIITIRLADSDINEHYAVDSPPSATLTD